MLPLTPLLGEIWLGWGWGGVAWNTGRGRDPNRETHQHWLIGSWDWDTRNEIRSHVMERVPGAPTLVGYKHRAPTCGWNWDKYERGRGHNVRKNTWATVMVSVGPQVFWVGQDQLQRNQGDSSKSRHSPRALWLLPRDATTVLFWAEAEWEDRRTFSEGGIWHLQLYHLGEDVPPYISAQNNTQ